jgi:PAS domain S-box-containing protein
MSLADLMPGQTAEHIAEGMRQTMQTGSARFERQQRCKDGRVIDVEVSVNYIPNDGGRFFCFHRDITERKRMEKRLLDALNYAQTIIEHSPTGIITYTAAGETVTANAAAASIVGATVEQLQANNFRQLESWRNSGLLAAAECALEVKERQVIEAHFTTTFGKEVWLTCRFEPFLYEGSSHLLMMLSDVMEERRAEEQLRLQSSALEAAANAIVITDTQGVVLWANPAFTTFTGYELSEVVGQNPRLLKSGRHDEAFYQNLWETIRGGRVWRGEMINRRKDGSDYQEEMTITPVKNQWGEVTHFIAVKQDITQRRALEEQFRQAQKMDAFGQLAGGVAHDFNNILAVIMMQADLLQVDASKGDTAGMALEIGQAAKRGADLTRQLLLFSRRQTLNTHPLDLNDTVTNLTKMLRRIVGEHIEMGIETAGSPLWVNADSGMLDQVLMNLVVNARDAMPGGGRLRIETAAAHLDAEAAQRFGQEGRPGPFACLSVKDEGCGIKREYLDRIFEPFFTTKEVGKGTGLGLATVFGIVRQHQGWIGVSSEVGKGSTFRVFLPRLNNGDDPVSADASSQTPHAKRETVLIVEDEKPLRSLMSNALTRLGYRVLEAASCVEALEIWRGAGNDVELLITDLVMPGELNGKELARQFCRERPGLKVIYTSGYSTDVTGTDLKLTEGINFLSKPFTLQHLAEILRRQFDQ